MPRILGISCEHDSGAAVIDESGTVLAAANEERYTRVKLFTGFPAGAIRSVLDVAGTEPGDVGIVALSTAMHVAASDWDWDAFSWKRGLVSLALRFRPFKALFENHRFIDTLVRLSRNRSFLRSLKRRLQGMGVTAPVLHLDHHAIALLPLVSLGHRSSVNHRSRWPIPQWADLPPAPSRVKRASW